MIRLIRRFFMGFRPLERAEPFGTTPMRNAAAVRQSTRNIPPNRPESAYHA
jgi:hypothetical protein